MVLLVIALRGCGRQCPLRRTVRPGLHADVGAREAGYLRATQADARRSVPDRLPGPARPS